MIPIPAPRAALLAGVLALAACTDATLREDPPELLSDMRLGHVVVVAENAQKVPISRDATPDEWKEAMTAALRERFGRTEGTRLYHLGVNIDGYALAPPGIPVVAAPKSVLVISANVWEDARGDERLNPEARQLTIFEGISGETVIGSGLTRGKAAQMRTLSRNAARAVENWLVENPDWFAPQGGGEDGGAEEAAGVAEAN